MNRLKNKKSLLLILGVVCVVVLSIVGFFRQKMSLRSYSYQNDAVGFSIQYPSNWLLEEDNGWEATADTEASPEKGIHLYLDASKGDGISAWGSISPLSLPAEFEKQAFNTLKGTRGELWQSIRDHQVTLFLIFPEPKNGIYYYLNVSMHQENYTLWAKQIHTVLKSFDF